MSVQRLVRPALNSSKRILKLPAQRGHVGFGLCAQRCDDQPEDIAQLGDLELQPPELDDGVVVACPGIGPDGADEIAHAFLAVEHAAAV